MTNYIIEQFNSLSHLVKELGKRPNNEIMRDCRDSENTDEPVWSGSETYEEAVQFALNGYEEPLDKIKRGMIDAEFNGKAPRRCRVTNDIVGYVPNVPAAVIGLPQSMIRSDVEVKKSKILSILYNPTMNGGTSAETINKAGVAVLSVINNLEKSGYRVALSVMCKCSEAGDDLAVAMVKIKDWRQPLDLKKTAFPLCCAAMQRRLGFKWLETCKGLKSHRHADGYGSSIEDYNSGKKKLDEAGLLSDTQFFINVNLCENNKFDPEKIAAACGIQKAR